MRCWPMSLIFSLVLCILSGCAQCFAGSAHLSELEQRWRNNKSSTSHCVELAQAYLEQDRWPDVITVLTPRLAAEPKNPDIHYLLGLAYINLGNPSEAQHHQQIVQSLDPKRGQELHRLFLVFETLADLENTTGATPTQETASGVDSALIRGILGE